MAGLKEHPFQVTTTLQGDGTTIKYDITKPNRSDAVGKAYRINPTTGLGELVGNGEAFDGKVIDVDDDHKFTAVFMSGGVKLPLGTNATVTKGDTLVGALGPSSAKGYVKAAVTPTDVASAFDQTELQTIIDSLKGSGEVHDFDTTHVLTPIAP